MAVGSHRHCGRSDIRNRQAQFLALEHRGGAVFRLPVARTEAGVVVDGAVSRVEPVSV